MKFRITRFRHWIVLLPLIALIGCSQSSNSPPAGALFPPESTQIRSADNQEVTNTAMTYLEAWREEDYSAMYALLTSLSRDALREEEFVEHYMSVAAEAAPRIDFDAARRARLGGVGHVHVGQVQIRSIGRLDRP